MVDPFESLIHEIAIKHGVVIGRDDPILILQTMNAKLMEDNSKSQQDMLNHYKEELEGIALRWENSTKEKSERILNASLAASKEAMANVLEESAKKTSITIKNDIGKLLSEMDRKLQRTKKIAMINFAASALTLIAVCISAFNLFR